MAYVPVSYRSVINNFATALGAGESDTGDWEENDCPDFAITVDSDVAGTIYTDFSLDGGENYSTFPVNGFAAGPAKPPHEGRKFGRWVRIRYTNGATAQTRFKLNTEFGQFLPLNAPLGADIASDADATIVRTVSSDLDLALGRFGGMIEDAKFGYVEGLASGDSGSTVWPLGNITGTGLGPAQKTFPTTASTIYAVADTGADTGVGITIPYLDATGAQQTGRVVLTGATPVRVSDTGDGLDCNRLFEDSGKAATGNVYVMRGNSVSSDGVPSDLTQVLAVMPAGLGQSHQAIDTVPLGKKYRIKEVIVTIARASGAAGSARISLRTREPGKTWRTKRRWNLSNGDFIKPVAGLVLSPLTNIEMRATTVSDAGTNITGEWHYDLVDT